METFSALIASVRGIHRSPMNSPHKGQWRGALMFPLICAQIKGWVSNRKAGDLRRHHAHYNVIVMVLLCCIQFDDVFRESLHLQRESRYCDGSLMSPTCIFECVDLNEDTIPSSCELIVKPICCHVVTAVELWLSEKNIDGPWGNFIWSTTEDGPQLRFLMDAEILFDMGASLDFGLNRL